MRVLIYIISNSSVLKYDDFASIYCTRATSGADLCIPACLLCISKETRVHDALSTSSTHAPYLDACVQKGCVIQCKLCSVGGIFTWVTVNFGEKRPTKNLEESIIGSFVESADQVLEFYITSNVLISSRIVKESSNLFLTFQF